MKYIAIMYKKHRKQLEIDHIGLLVLGLIITTLLICSINKSLTSKIFLISEQTCYVNYETLKYRIIFPSVTSKSLILLYKRGWFILYI